MIVSKKQGLTSSGAESRPVLLDVQELRTYLYTSRGVVKAVDGVSFQLRRGETVGIIGESGCGKSMTALSLLRLLPQPVGRIVSGKVLLDGVDLLTLDEEEMRHVRGREIGLILQDPHTSLNPVFTIGNQIQEAMRSGARSAKERAMDLLRFVRVSDAARRWTSYPHEMSGGMKQRVVGAIALAGDPKVIIADEPTTALDVTIQAQYLRLLKEIQRETNLALVFVTHDLGIVGSMCDRAAVMYAGRIVEQGSVSELLEHPSHPYTRALLNAVPRIEERVDKLEAIEGQPPILIDPAPGCRFAPRCAYADSRCYEKDPPYFVGNDGQLSACWRLEGVWNRASTS